MSKKIIIGDIHACSFELNALLDKISPTADDQIIALGDIFDRGPDNAGILQLFSENPQFSTIKGNHERKHLLVHQHLCKAARSQVITREELGEDYPALLEFARTLPNYIILDAAILVHGAIEPGVPLDRQRETVLLSTMTGEQYLEANFAKPWYELIEPEKPIIFGHQVVSKPFIYNDMIYGIDTGCCNGRRLTALVLPDFQLTSVDAKMDYWRESRRLYAATHRKNEPASTRKKQVVDPHIDYQKTHENIMNLMESIKGPTKSRKEFALIVNREYDSSLLRKLLFRAYSGKLPVDHLKTKDIDQLGELLAKYDEVEEERKRS